MGYMNDPDWYYRRTNRNDYQQYENPAQGGLQKPTEPTQKGTTAARTGGGGSGRGGYGGGGGIRRPAGLEYYRPGRFNPSNINRQANLRADAQVREQIAANNAARMQARNEYRNAIMELGYNRQKQRGAAIQQGANDRGRLNNMMLNRDMGYGGAADTSLSNLMQATQGVLGGIESDYNMGFRQQQNDLNTNLNQYAEADRVARANRAALYQELYDTLYGTNWDRYLANENLLLNAMQQRNQTRSIGY